MFTHQIITISAQDDDIRLDRWFHRHYPKASKGLIEKLARKGAIRLDGKRVKTNIRVKAHMQLKIPAAILEAQSKIQDTTPKAKPSDSDIRMIKDQIIFEDRFILAVNKPHGLASQGGSGIEKSLISIIQAMGQTEGYKPHLVHRLDKDTSGIMILAKSPDMAAALTKNFQRRDIRKIYLAVLAGQARPAEGHISLPLIKRGSKGQQKMVADYEHGQTAESLYQTLETAGQVASIVALSPLTGRTHQLRVHANDALECPVLSDGKYGGEKAFIPNLSKKLHLHAWQLHFSHPKTGQHMQLIAPIADHICQSISELGMQIPDSSAYEVEKYNTR